MLFWTLPKGYGYLQFNTYKMINTDTHTSILVASPPFTIGTVLPACIRYWPIECPFRFRIGLTEEIHTKWDAFRRLRLLLIRICKKEFISVNTLVCFPIYFNLVWLHHFLYCFSNIAKTHIYTCTLWKETMLLLHTHDNLLRQSHMLTLMPVSVASLTASSKRSYFGLKVTVKAQSMILPKTHTHTHTKCFVLTLWIKERFFVISKLC